MTYADYTYYVGTFGGRMSESEFTGAAVKASALIDSFTSLRAQTADAVYAERIKNACCAVADELVSGESAVSSVTNDGYSVTFAGASPESKRLYNAVALYLMETGLMYAGV